MDSGFESDWSKRTEHLAHNLSPKCDIFPQEGKINCYLSKRLISL